MYDGIKQLDATRALLSEPSGRGNLTRFQRCWRYGAALDAWSRFSFGERPKDPRTGRRDDVAVVPADAKSIATKPVWRNPAICRPCSNGLPSMQACELRA